MTQGKKTLNATPVRVAISTSFHTSLDHLQHRWTPVCGWACQPGALVLLDPKNPWPSGEILSAECVLEESEAGGRSLHVRAEQGGWRCWEIQESHAQGSSEYLANSVHYISSFHETGPLHYRRYFHCTEQDGIVVYRPWAARFAGFSPKEKPCR